jgi:hypothetical protein
MPSRDYYNQPLQGPPQLLQGRHQSSIVVNRIREHTTGENATTTVIAILIVTVLSTTIQTIITTNVSVKAAIVNTMASARTTIMTTTSQPMCITTVNRRH